MLTAIDICYRYKTYTFKSTLLNDSAVTPVKLLNQNFKICLYYQKNKKKYIQELEKKAIWEDLALWLTCSIGAVPLLVVRAILNWIRSERALVLLTCTSVSF